MTHVTGRFLAPDHPRQVTVRLDEGGRVAEVHDDPLAEPPAAEGLIVPSPVNAHTHVGDALVRLVRGETVPADLAAVVAPPDGLKHRILQSADRGELLEGVRGVVGEMLAAGSNRFLDFREGGLPGIELLEEALEDLAAAPTVLARPEGMGYDEAEVDALLDRAHGIGLSSIDDVGEPVAESLAEHAHQRGKLFALHASEGAREPVDRLLALDPAFVVHMVEATRGDLEAVADAGVPVVVCPRSNAHFASLPPVVEMVEAGVTVALGTDNAMLHEADPFAEAAFLHERVPELPAREVARMLLWNGLELVPGAPRDPLAVGEAPGFVVVEDPGGDPWEAVLREPRVVWTPWHGGV